MSDGQDWSSVQIGTGARRAVGGAGAARPHVSASVIAAAKLDAAEDSAKPKYFSVASVGEIQAYRRENELTQKQLDGRCSFPAGTLSALEGRRRTPSSRELQVLNNLLRSRLVVE
jgi:DNA-binding transcriptional regulator YiaG